MVFNEFLIIFDIRNITQSAYSFNGTPVIKLQPIVSSILGHVFSILPCADKTLYFAIFPKHVFGIIHISPTISILCQKILAENCLQCTFFGYIRTLYPIFRVRFDNQNTLSNLRVYNTSNSSDIHYFNI